MATFKFVISSGPQSFQVEKDQNACPVAGKKIGDTFSGDFLGLADYELRITGGSDKDGFPMRKDIEGVMRKKIITGEGIGFHADSEGLRKRKLLRGDIIGQDIVQINCVVVKKGSIPIEKVLGKEKKEEQTEG